ncbi:MAG: T9SS type A sorting domain-containing protein [Bacteroidia bacterium]
MIKKILFVGMSIVTFGVLNANAQALPNPGFETWVHTSGPPAYDDPQGYATANILSNSFLGSNPVSVFKETTIIHNGAAAMKIVSVALTNNPLSATLPDTIGLAVTGSVSGSGIKTGFAYAAIPSAFQFYAEYIPNGVDTAWGLSALTHFNTITHKRDTLDVAVIRIAGNVSTYTLFTTPYISLLTGTPDTCIVAFSATNPRKTGRHHAGSIFYVDDANLNTTGIPENSMATEHVSVFPNPAINELNVVTTNMKNATSVIVYDITGRKINSYNIANQEHLKISTDEYAAGLYIYQITDKNNNTMHTGKFNVIK